MAPKSDDVHTHPPLSDQSLFFDLVQFILHISKSTDIFELYLPSNILLRVCNILLNKLVHTYADPCQTTVFISCT